MDKMRCLWSAHQRWPLFGVMCLVFILFAGCNSHDTSIQTNKPIPTTYAYVATPPTAFPTTTLAKGACHSQSTNGTLPADIPMPPQTIFMGSIGIGGGGEYEYAFCTSTTTGDAITAYLNRTLPAAGWHPYNPQTDTSGCDDHDFQWIKAHQGLGIHVADGNFPPLWHIFICPSIDG